MIRCSRCRREGPACSCQTSDPALLAPVRLAQMEAANRRLRSDVAALEAECASLRAELARATRVVAAEPLSSTWAGPQEETQPSISAVRGGER